MPANFCVRVSFFGAVVLVDPATPLVSWGLIRPCFIEVGGALLVRLFTESGGLSSAPQETRKTTAERQRTASIFARDRAVSPFWTSG